MTKKAAWRKGRGTTPRVASCVSTTEPSKAGDSPGDRRHAEWGGRRKRGAAAFFFFSNDREAPQGKLLRRCSCFGDATYENDDSDAVRGGKTGTRGARARGRRSAPWAGARRKAASLRPSDPTISSFVPHVGDRAVLGRRCRSLPAVSFFRLRPLSFSCPLSELSAEILWRVNIRTEPWRSQKSAHRWRDRVVPGSRAVWSQPADSTPAARSPRCTDPTLFRHLCVRRGDSCEPLFGVGGLPDADGASTRWGRASTPRPPARSFGSFKRWCRLPASACCRRRGERVREKYRGSAARGPPRRSVPRRR